MKRKSLGKRLGSALYLMSILVSSLVIPTLLMPDSETEIEKKTDESILPKRGVNAPMEKESEAAAETSATPSYSWYCKHMKNGERPPCPSEMQFISSHGGYFLGVDKPIIYLTFDAGYENGNIERILDTLKEEDVPAAFFVLDNLVLKNTDLVKRMTDEGHIVANHTAKHRDMTKCTSQENFAAELKAMSDLYEEKIGLPMAKYYRPPEGKLNEENLVWADALGYKTVLWSYAYADWDNSNQMSEEKAVKMLTEGTHNGEILLLHPTSKTNADILGKMIKSWKEMGYSFGTLDDLTSAGTEK